MTASEGQAGEQGNGESGDVALIREALTYPIRCVGNGKVLEAFERLVAERDEWKATAETLQDEGAMADLLANAEAERDEALAWNQRLRNAVNAALCNESEWWVTATAALDSGESVGEVSEGEDVRPTLGFNVASGADQAAPAPSLTSTTSAESERLRAALTEIAAFNPAKGYQRAVDQREMIAVAREALAAVLGEQREADKASSGDGSAVVVEDSE